MSDVLDKRITSPEQAAAASVAAFADRYHYRITISIQGRVRFLSHLETVDTLLGCLRRSGVVLALSEGMRPKPRIKMAMPRPVATEAWADIVEVELRDPIDADQFALQLSEAMPSGVLVHRVERIEGAYASAASRVAGAVWRWVFPANEMRIDELAAAATQLRNAREIVIERASPKKRTKTVDVRQFIGDIDAVETGEGPALRAFVHLTELGSAKPDEVIRALHAALERNVRPLRTIRESIALAQPGSGREAAPELVGADVPDGPAKPWGAC